MRMNTQPTYTFVYLILGDLYSPYQMNKTSSHIMTIVFLFLALQLKYSFGKNVHLIT